jgi:3-deoxy-D-manno-octulosonic-acid transferase
LNDAGAIVQLPPVDADRAPAELAGALNELLADPERRKELAKRATQLIATNQGSAERTIKLIAPLLAAKRRDGSQSNSVLAAKPQTS